VLNYLDRQQGFEAVEMIAGYSGKRDQWKARELREDGRVIVFI